MAVLTREAPPDGNDFENIADSMPHMVWLAELRRGHHLPQPPHS